MGNGNTQPKRRQNWPQNTLNRLLARKTMRKAFLSDALVLQARIPVMAPNPELLKQSGAGKYNGAIAKGYDAKREDSEKWKAEDRIMRGMLTDLPRGTSVLDVPVGTGRFIPFYEEFGFNVLGL